MNIDAHQHFWNYDPKEYPWITDQLAKLRRDFLPADLEREWACLPVDGSIAVQARQTLEESRWLLLLADQSPAIRGVVGWVDLRSERVDEQLAEFSGQPKFVGVRHVVQDEPDDDFMLQPAFLRGLGCLKQFNLTYDLLLHPKHLPVAIKVVGQLPDQRFVLDHLAKPSIRSGTLLPWKDHIRELAAYENVHCKISGMVTEAKWEGWKQTDFRPYLDVVFEAFGADRLMFGSDWPVCLLAATYQQVFGIVHNCLQQFPEDVRQKVMGENAARFYGIEASY
jgi:L-fuconolactonase